VIFTNSFYCVAPARYKSVERKNANLDAFLTKQAFPAVNDNNYNVI